ncbi:MAG: hypothetical protein IJJ44_09025 [Solobacterium sp.]|nr:hypothetical protein [Solobacterium sp.]
MERAEDGNVSSAFFFSGEQKMHKYPKTRLEKCVKTLKTPSKKCGYVEKIV